MAPTGLTVCVGIPSFGMVSTYFMQSRMSQQFPLVSSAIDKVVLNKPIAEARNEIVEFALQQGAQYLFWLDDDVIAPPDAFMKLYRHQKDVINGVYWSKSNPPMPLLFRDHLNGPYWDWHVGDLIEIDAAGNGLTLVKMDVYRKISKELGDPWYSTDYSSFKNVSESPLNNTEDIYFYWKAKKAGYKIWADTSVQALHYDKVNQVLYQMPPFAPQATAEFEIKPAGEKLIADLGSGFVTPYMLDEGKVVTFDIREETKPDVVCDVRFLPVPNETFDVVHSSHTLEHFSYLTVDKVLREWTRILKVGGELRLRLPNLRWSAKRIAEDMMSPYDYKVLYGGQEYPKNFHGSGYTPNTIKALIESLGLYENIQVKEGEIDGPPGSDSWDMLVKATKKGNPPAIDNVTPEHYEQPAASTTLWPFKVFDEIKEVKEITSEVVEEELAKWGTKSLKPSIQLSALEPKAETKPRTRKRSTK